MQNDDQPVLNLLAEIHETRLQAGLEVRDVKRRRVRCASIVALVVVVIGFTSFLLKNVRFGEHGGYGVIGGTFIMDIVPDSEASALLTVDINADVCLRDSDDLHLIASTNVPGFSGDCAHVLPEGQGILVGGMDYSSGRDVAGIACLTTGGRNASRSVAWTRRFGVDSAIRQIASSRDGGLIALGTFEYQGANARVILYDIGEQTVIRETRAATGICVTSIAFSPSGDLLAYATGDIGNLPAPGLLCIERLNAEGDGIFTPTPDATVTSFRFTSDGTRLLAADYAGNISVYDTVDLSRLSSWKVEAHSIEEIALIGGDRYLVVGGTKTCAMAGAPSLRNLQTTGMIQLWDLDREQLLDEQVLPHGMLAGIAIIDNGRKVAAVSTLNDEIYCVDLSGAIP